MSETEEVGIDQKNHGVIALVSIWTKCNELTPSILTHLIGNEEHHKEDNGSSHKLMIDDTSWYPATVILKVGENVCLFLASFCNERAMFKDDLYKKRTGMNFGFWVSLELQ